MKVIIAGSRHIINYWALLEAIQESGFTITEVISGTARGPDKMGEKWALIENIPIKSFPAQWGDLARPGAVIRHNDYGKPFDAKAGLWRNELMADYADSLIVLWDGKSAGTKHMIGEMKKRGKPVYVHSGESNEIA